MNQILKPPAYFLTKLISQLKYNNHLKCPIKKKKHISENIH